MDALSKGLSGEKSNGIPTFVTQDVRGFVVLCQDGTLFTEVLEAREIPAVGDEIMMGYNPPARVTRRVFDYKNSKAFILTDGLNVR